MRRLGVVSLVGVIISDWAKVQEPDCVLYVDSNLKSMFLSQNHAQLFYDIGHFFGGEICLAANFWADSAFFTVVCRTEKFTDIVIILGEINASVVWIKK